MKRRTFLQRSTLSLTAFGCSQLGLSLAASRYQQVLAAPTPRKLALLVGINQYNNPLNGCLTDVELQRELLLHRFGFLPGDILTLTDHQATRTAIVQGFLNHLIEPARSGDVVVFHFSGYGGTVTAATGDTQTSLVTAGPALASGDTLVADDLLEDTLLLLLRSLQTNRFTVILDTSYIYPGKLLQGNWRIRTRPTAAIVQPSKAELTLQDHLLAQLDSETRKRWDSPYTRVPATPRLPLPGVLLDASQPGQLALEAKWNGFSSGLFTQALTQQLWQTTPAPTLRISLGRAKEQVEQRTNQEQQPRLVGQKGQEQALQPYFLPLPEQAAAGAVLAVEDGKTAHLWLAGMAINVLEHIGPGSLFVIPNLAPIELQLLSRDGLTAKARILGSGTVNDQPAAVVPGQPVTERLRLLPRNLGLTIALDNTLERIERVDAISALSAIPRVTSTLVGEQAADYLFSKVTATPPTQVAALPTSNLPAIVPPRNQTTGGYGLFSAGREIIANTAGEAVKAAVRRLIPKLHTLLASKLLHLTVNETASHLKLRATLATLAPQEKTWLKRETHRLSQTDPHPNPPAAPEANGLISLAIGNRIQYQIENRSSELLYILLLGLDNNGDLFFLSSPRLLPPDSASPELTSREQRAALERLSGWVAAGETLTLPQTTTSFQWVLSGAAGLVETYLICSRVPFTQTWNLLATTVRPGADTPAVYPLPNPLEVAQAVLQDLQQTGESNKASSDTLALDMATYTTLRFTYRVV